MTKYVSLLEKNARLTIKMSTVSYFIGLVISSGIVVPL